MVYQWALMMAGQMDEQMVDTQAAMWGIELAGLMVKKLVELSVFSKVARLVLKKVLDWAVEWDSQWVERLVGS
jgi:hypothetical protein